jgi:hypothetical protein
MPFPLVRGKRNRQPETAGTEQILLVEDEEGILDVVSEMLTGLG